MKTKTFISFLRPFLLAALLVIVSCSEDATDVSTEDYKNGFLISGEGSEAGSGAIYYVSNDYKTSTAKVFNKVNAEDLGIYLQSVSFKDDNAYIVVDNQNTITVVNQSTFEKVGIINEELIKPRYMAIIDDKAYVTNWGNGSSETDAFIAIVDLTSLKVTEKIAVGNGPERIVAKKGKLYVSHKGGLSTNNIVSVIDISNNSVTTIDVKDNPDELLFDANDNLIVLSEGQTLYDADWNVIGNTPGAISTINIADNSLLSESIFEESSHPSLMVSEGSDLFYAVGNNIFKTSIDNINLSNSSVLTVDGYLYGMAVKDNNLFTLNANFSDVSTLEIHDLESTKSEKTILEAPIGASKIYFN